MSSILIESVCPDLRGQHCLPMPLLRYFSLHFNRPSSHRRRLAQGL
jgi:hypothetical protein